MELKIMNLFSRKNRCSFKQAVLEESAENIKNPGRGFYRVFSMDACKGAPLAEWNYAIKEEESLALFIVDIGAFRDCDITEEAKKNIAEAFSFFREHKKELLLRVVYDREGKGLEKEPSRLFRILSHMEELSPVIAKNEDIIFVLQGLFVGSWGEMHGSRYLTKEALTTLYSKQRHLLGEQIFIAVRRPDQWKMIGGGSNEPSVEGAKPHRAIRLAIFDDGLLGSDTDLGTYPSEARNENIAFMGDVGLLAPCSGEAVGQESYGEAENAEAYFRKIRLACLNGGYDPRVLDRLKISTLCGQNAYDYIGSHLGYRFLVTDAHLKKEKGDLLLSVAIENRGFSPIFEECGMYLLMECGEKILPQEKTDFRTILPGERRTVKFFARELCAGMLTFFMYRTKDRQPIRLANVSAGEGVTIGTFLNER